MMEEVLLYALGGIFVNFFHLYCWCNLFNIKINCKKLKFCISLILLTIIGTLLAFTVPQYVRMIICMIVLTVINYTMFVHNFRESIIGVLISQLVVMVSEFFLVIVISLLFNNGMEYFSSTLIGILLINVLTALLSFGFLFIKIPKRVFNYCINFTNLMKQREILIYFIMIITVAIVSTAETYMNWSVTIVLTTNTIMALIFIIMVVKFANAKDKYNRMNSKYQTSITSLNEYGEILDKYRVSTHENKNQLLTIQKMTKDKNVIKYIDSLIDEKIKDNEKVMNKTFKIPDGGFRSIIYAKLCKIDELKITYKLNIANDVKTVDLIKIDDLLVRDVCTILGVYLDNAIEAVRDLKKKNIFIEIYVMDGYLCFDITNNFEGVLDISKINKPKYTTKGEGHGYGLTLVDKIVGENENIENECEVVNNMITQRVKIKM